MPQGRAKAAVQPEAHRGQTRPGETPLGYSQKATGAGADRHREGLTRRGRSSPNPRALRRPGTACLTTAPSGGGRHGRRLRIRRYAPPVSDPPAPGPDRDRDRPSPPPPGTNKMQTREENSNNNKQAGHENGNVHQAAALALLVCRKRVAETSGGKQEEPNGAGHDQGNPDGERPHAVRFPGRQLKRSSPLPLDGPAIRQIPAHEQAVEALAQPAPTTDHARMPAHVGRPCAWPGCLQPGLRPAPARGVFPDVSQAGTAHRPIGAPRRI